MKSFVALDVVSSESSIANSDEDCTVFPMAQRGRRSDHRDHALEKPFDETFWFKVSGTSSLLSLQIVLISKT